MKRISIKMASYSFEAELEETLAPQTCGEFIKLLPYHEKLLQVRWSGEACWVPMGTTKLNVGFENHTSYPSPGQILYYPGGYSETEILIPYGSVCFSSKAGQLAGNHFLTIVEGNHHLVDVGKKVQWDGVQDIVFEEIR